MRADIYLTTHGHTASRQQAKQLIGGGNVTVDGKQISKPSEEIPDGEHTVELRNLLPYVGRGGLKLEAALDAFGLDVSGRKALDIGASTGGFTDCLLRRGAGHVWAVDSGTGQLAKVLREDSRVTSMERFNARNLTSADVGGMVDLVVMDVSFISATYLIPLFPALLNVPGDAVCLIKPQFEVGRERIGKGGLVKDADAHRFAVERVVQAGKNAGMVPVSLIPSPISGGDGNREFLVRFSLGRAEARELTEEQIRSVTG